MREILPLTSALPAIMRRFLIIITIFLSFSVQAQKGIVPDSVRQDLSFKCKTVFSDSVYFNLRPICESKNETEIRLILSGFKAPATLIILAYTDSVWTAKKYQYQRGYLGTQIDVTNFIPDKFATDLTLNAIFPILLTNGIFSLPDQEELHIKRTISDGGGFMIQYKVKDKFRSYRYVNPESYSELHPEISELKKAALIVKTITGLFK